jgi:hypothetical protein
VLSGDLEEAKPPGKRRQNGERAPISKADALVLGARLVTPRYQPAGEMKVRGERAKGGDDNLKVGNKPRSNSKLPRNEPPTLPDLGISKMLSSRRGTVYSSLASRPALLSPLILMDGLAGACGPTTSRACAPPSSSLSPP